MAKRKKFRERSKKRIKYSERIDKWGITMYTAVEEG